MSVVSNYAIGEVIRLLQKEALNYKPSIVSALAKKGEPYKVLISCLLSLRTKDSTTEIASKRLFESADNPKDMLGLSVQNIESLIYPVGFYRNKARVIRNVSRDILGRHRGLVPSTMEELIALNGVGRKTANLVLTMGFGKYGICVDTHVHRICNRLGYVTTKTPEETESVLRRKLPKRYWIEINDLLVLYGQNVCRPVSPFCSKCNIYRYCDRVKVKHKR